MRVLIFLEEMRFAFLDLAYCSNDGISSHRGPEDSAEREEGVPLYRNERIMSFACSMFIEE